MPHARPESATALAPRREGEPPGEGLVSLQQSAGNLAVQALVQRSAAAPPAIRRALATSPRPRPRRPVPAVSPVAGGMVQRHSSWEHQLLGDADPENLAKLGTWQDLIEQTKLEGVYGFRKPKNDSAKVDLQLGGKQGSVQVTKGNVMHILAQHLQLLNDWQASPPTQDSGGKMDPKYQTVLVSVPGGKPDGSPLIITYGEMNTLADYYGNLDVMKGADKAKRWMVVQSVRQETFFRLKDIYQQLEGSLTSTEKTDQDVKDSQKLTEGNTRFNQKLGYKFQGAMLPDYVSGVKGQIDLLKLGGAGGTGSNEYAATLGRNACHFVPESWHAWSSYHQKGREQAALAWQATQAADALADQQKHGQAPQDADTKIADFRKEAGERTNEALISNGFGDHYLQDSYASGHMINKTQIMQWFVQWLDKNKYTMDFAKDETWQRIQAIAYRQPEVASKLQYDKSEVQGVGDNKKNRARNPQAVEDVGGDWEKRFKAAGLSVPASLRTPGSPTRKVVEWWQVETAGGGPREQNGTDILLNSGDLGFAEVLKALTDLLADGVISKGGQSNDETGRKYMSGAFQLNPSMSREHFAAMTFALRQEYVPRDAKWFKMVREGGAKGQDANYQRMAAAVTFQDYWTFMNNGYLQKSTNALHNVFCQNGIEVSSGENQPLFMVYGDDAMFSSQSAKGVEHSGQTAHMSRDAILAITEGRQPQQTTEQILGRLPSWVRPKGAPKAVSIEAWHNPAAKDLLRNYCETDVFPEMGFMDKAAGALGDLSEFISKDNNPPHGGDAF
jgi:hypothetical protein